jgi:phenylacetate-CoA ligase
LAALAREFEESQWLTAAEIEAKQHRQLVALATHAAAHSPHFARRLAAAGLAPRDLATPEGLRRLPVLRRREIQQAGADFYCSAIPEGHGPLRESRTSGSTGEPVTIRRTAVSQLFWRAVSLRFHAWTGRDLTKRCTTIRVDNHKVTV